MKIPEPSQRERIALFRLSVIGDLLAQELELGDLNKQLQERSEKRYRPPEAASTRQYHWKTLQRWYYAAKSDLAAGLLPESRSRGFALKLTEEQRALLLEMRQEHPTASAELVLSEAVRNGVVGEHELTLSTLRRLFRISGLPRLSRRKIDRREDVQRRRWQAKHPGELWHGDVCHLILADERGRPRRVLVHGLLDDASRYCVALMPRLHEREQDMLEVLCGALLRHPAPHTLYLDNGACYRGEVLQLFCQRLGIRLVHAKPYSPEARGKMERFWRSMRQRCSDHLQPSASVHQVGQALWAWLDADYHRRPHGGLFGEPPRRRYLAELGARPAPLTARQLAAALEVEQGRQVRGDGTFELDGTTYEVSGRHLAGKKVTVVVDALSEKPLRVSWQGQPVRFGVCDPVANRHRPRPVAATGNGSDGDHPGTTRAEAPFDPIAALIAKAREEVDDDE
ncbi:MAG: transposase [Deltaproteobacteria bacterium]|nr:transposase [Deltaproteobacteria bacterium]